MFSLSIEQAEKIIKENDITWDIVPKQAFREDYDFSGTRSASITSLESKHGVK